MLRTCKSALVRAYRFVRRRPLTTFVLVILLLAIGGTVGIYGYAVRQWRQAQTAVRERRPTDANANLQFCLRIWPSDPNVHRLAARAARMAGDYPAAEQHLTRCLEIESGASEDTQLEFLLLRAQSGEVEEVEAILLLFVERQHRDSELILETLAGVHMHNLRYGPAFSRLSEWIRQFPNTARPYHYRGWVLERLNQPSSAMEDYHRALQLYPNLDRVRLRVAEMYLEDKEPLRALPHLELLLARNPNQPEAQARLGQCRFMQGRHAEARKLLERASAALPHDTTTQLFLARLDIFDQDPARAEKRLRSILASDLSDTEARYTLVTTLRLQRRDAEAEAEMVEYDRQREVLDRANKLLQVEAKHPSRNPQAAFEIGSLLLGIRHDRQGLHWLDEALVRDPNHRATHELLADHFEKIGNRERAAFHRRKLLK
jgi:tetratricopeptide (TPR) repeat protein